MHPYADIYRHTPLLANKWGGPLDRPITLFCSLQISPHLFNLTAAVCRQAQKWDSVFLEDAVFQPIPLGLFGAGRSLDHAELVIEGILHRLKLAGIATEGKIRLWAGYVFL